MPGYIIHLCEGRYIADKLHISKESQPELLNDFLLGCVLPDAVMDKALTHFRPEWQNDLITKYPDIDHILSEYPVEAMTPADLGILAHLMMDAAYVEEFWPQYFQFEAGDNTPTCVTRDIDHVRMHELSMQPEGRCIPFRDFFSEQFFYGDYNVTNPLFIRDFSPIIPKVSSPDMTIKKCLCFSQSRLQNDLDSLIAVAGHDTASAVVAVPALDRNFAYLSSGTWSLMGVETDAPVINEETEALNFTNEGGVAGTIRLLKNICGMWLLERCRCDWEEISYPELIAEAEASEPFRSLINPDDALFANPMNMEQAIRTYCADHHQPIPETRGQVVRCIFESLALRYRQVLENLRGLSPRPVEALHVIGGGSRNDLLNQWTANAVGIPVVAGPSEATAIGNVMIQALTAGAASDVVSMRQLINRSIPLKTFTPENVEVWNAAYLHFLQLA